MASDTLYTKKETDRLDKYGDTIDGIVDKLSTLVDEDLKKGDARKVRVLIEAITASTDSIHKSANNKVKADANNNDAEVKKQIAATIKELALSKSRHVDHDDIDREKMFGDIKAPDDIVYNEDAIGSGSLSMSDIEKKKD